MPREQTLLERLRSGETPASGRSAAENVNLLARSVEQNVSRILNARQGHCPAHMDYGSPPPSEIVYDFPASITRMQRHIKEVLGRYEPRLGEIEVIHLENDDKNRLVLQYQLQARLVTSSSKAWISLHIRMDPSGRITVRR